MSERLDDECPRPVRMSSAVVAGLSPGIFPASVYRCTDPDQAETLLGGQAEGYAYQRDGHPNADMLAEKCGRLHEARWALITSTGMSALSVATLGLLRSGDHLLVSDQLYGRSTQLLTEQWQRLGVQTTTVDMLDIDAVHRALRGDTRLLVVETLTNPLLRVAPVDQLAEAAHARGARLLVDNTFATPAVCRPLALGADYVLESLSKMMNGHSDVMLGLLCGRDDEADLFRDTMSVWGMSSSPFDSWLALRGLSTLHLRVERASANAAFVADQLGPHRAVTRVTYPGLADHPDFAHVRRLFTPSQAGNMVTFQVTGGRAEVSQLMAQVDEIPFCPSLGEISTTWSHPASTSHRRLSAEERSQLGIVEGTVRLSVGTESADWIWMTIKQGLDKLR